MCSKASEILRPAVPNGGGRKPETNRPVLSVKGALLLGSISLRTGLPEPFAHARPSLPLASFANSRANNFTLLRLIFAWLVLFGHSWQIVGVDGRDPLSAMLPDNRGIGAVAVNGFFLISGFLVTGSIARRTPLQFIAARVLRIFPALLVCVLLSVFLLGPLATSEPLAAYFHSSVTWGYLANLALWPDLKWYLPGVFEDHPVDVVNSSLWTLPAEISCYIWLAAVGFLGRLDSPLRANLTILALFYLGHQYYDALPLFAGHHGWDRRAAYFLIGVLAWVNRAYIPMHAALAGMALLVAALAVALPIARLSFDLLSAVCLPYLVFYAAYLLKHVDLDRRLGDLSFGLYIYAFPVQQLLFWPGQLPWTNLALATGAASALAFLSWHVIEKRALSWRRLLDQGAQPPDTTAVTKPSAARPLQ